MSVLVRWDKNIVVSCDFPIFFSSVDWKKILSSKKFPYKLGLRLSHRNDAKSISAV